jgi:hypothetical protein
VEFLVGLDGGEAGVAVADGGDADGVVVLKQGQKALAAFGLVGAARAGVAGFEVIARGAEDARGFAPRVLLHLAGQAVRDLEVPVNLVELERQRVDGGVRPGLKGDGVFGRGGVQLGAGGITLLPQPRDENLREGDPLALRDDGGAGANVGEYIGDGLHLRHRVVELIQARVAGVRVRVHQAGDDEAAPRVHDAGVRPGEPGDVGVFSDGQDFLPAHGDGLDQRELFVHGRHLGVSYDEIGRLGGPQEKRSGQQKYRWQGGGEAASKQSRGHGYEY